MINRTYDILAETTVKKLRQDIVKFFKWCRAKNLFPLDKPLPCDPLYLDVLIKRVGRRRKGIPHPALAQKDVARFVAMLTDSRYVFRSGFLPLLFTLLTASRIGNVIGSLNRELTQPVRWDDINRDISQWTISANNMKAGRFNGKHVVPLSRQVKALLLLVKAYQKSLGIQSEYIFSNKNGHRFDYRQIPLLIRWLSKTDEKSGGRGFYDSETGLLMHAHGLRSSFKTWGTDHGIDWTLTEIALHHSIDRLRYDRAKAINRRRKVMQQWADFCFSRVDPDWLQKALKILDDRTVQQPQYSISHKSSLLLPYTPLN